MNKIKLGDFVQLFDKDDITIALYDNNISWEHEVYIKYYLKSDDDDFNFEKDNEITKYFNYNVVRFYEDGREMIIIIEKE